MYLNMRALPFAPPRTYLLMFPAAADGLPWDVDGWRMEQTLKWGGQLPFGRMESVLL